MVIVEYYNGLVAEHKVQVYTQTFLYIHFPLKGTLLQAHDKFIVQIGQSAPLLLWYNVQPVMHHKTHGDIHYPHTM